MSVEVKQYGLQRSGTSVLWWLLKENYDVTVLTNQGGWKHGSHNPRRWPRETHVVVSVMHPLPWLVNFWRYCRGYDRRPFRKFLTRNWCSPVHLWNWAYQHWTRIQLADHELAEVRYKDLLASISSTMLRVQTVMKLPRLRRPFRRPKGYVDPHPPPGAKGFDPAWFTEGKFMRHYTPDLLAFVGNRLLPELMERFCYSMEDWPCPG